MIVHIKKMGDQYILELDPSIIEKMQIDETTPLIIKADTEGLFCAPVDDVSEAEFQASLEKVNQNYAKALQKLAE
ncbi:hypothetical protein [Bremerella sp. P1]|uniref:hypothetical protein n=1 Tax=Bremerella sp. P1 TaxID=3026424 RepID=UPI0023689CE9|nr:hypothetical protein [Bremerella sp. P1]WDI45029.1 hypothetical protein PSR63_13880 [Bremerella sp. P1]